MLDLELTTAFDCLSNIEQGNDCQECNVSMYLDRRKEMTPQYKSQMMSTMARMAALLTGLNLQHSQHECSPCLLALQSRKG